MFRWIARSAMTALVAASLVLWLQPAAAADRSALAAAAASITLEELKGHIDVLADDSFEGREAGSRGGRAAGNYLHRAFESLALVPAGDDGTYFQSFQGAMRNVLGLVEGSDPQLKQEVILVGAHYDHVGYGRRGNSFGPLGYIHNGADDNASGVAGLLEVIDAVQRLPQPPRRSILFVLWDGEEQGLLGSRYWVSRPTVPLDRIVLALNLDMIGRMQGGKLDVYGTRTAPGLRRLVSEANAQPGATIDFGWKMKSDSDHWPLFERRIPVLMFHTGLHEDYHRPSDDAHRINHEGLAIAAQLVFYVIVHAADADARPSFRDAARRESPTDRTQLEQASPPQPPRFGLPYRFEAGDPPRVVLSGVTAGSPAEKAGFRAGDELLSFQGEAIRDETRFRLALLAASGETALLVQREGTQTPLLLKVAPEGDPIRVGITWRMDDAEPGTAVITQVVFGSAAHAAGLAVRDRIYAVAGRAFRSQDEFTALLKTAPAPLELLIERDGRLQTVALEVLDPQG